MDAMGMSELTSAQILAVKCPLCGAQAGIHCAMKNGAQRLISAPHRDRRLLAGELRIRQISTLRIAV
jgi:hypothetical protein